MQSSYILEFPSYLEESIGFRPDHEVGPDPLEKNIQGKAEQQWLPTLVGNVSYVDVDLSRRLRRVAVVTIPAARIHGCSPEASSPRHGGFVGPHLASTH